MTNYEPFSHEFLIKTVQESHLRLRQPNYKKSVKGSTYSKHVSGLSDLRKRLVEMLKKLDRNKKEFFPIGAHVEYKFLNPTNDDWWGIGSEMSKDAIVTDYQDENVVIQIEGEVSTIVVSPIYLKLKYIRLDY